MFLDMAHDIDAVRRLAASTGTHVYAERAHALTMTLTSRGSISVDERSGRGVALHDGVREVSAPLDPDHPDAMSLARTMRGLPAGRYAIGAGTGRAAGSPGLLLEEVTALAQRCRSIAAGTPHIELTIDCIWRTAAMCRADADAVSKSESWSRVSAFARTEVGGDAGKFTVFTAPVVLTAAGTIELLEHFTEEQIHRAVDQARAQAGRLAAAPAPPSGTMPVIFAPRAAGTIAHELVGHLLESDNVARRRAAPAVTRGAGIGHDELTVLNDGTGAFPWSGAPFDDEGTPSGRTALVRHGVVVGHLSDRGHDGVGGHGRRAGYDSEVLPRMHTVVVAPGAAAPQSLLDVPAGLLVLDLSRATFDPATGRGVAQIREAEVIEGGRVAATTRGGLIRCDVVGALGRIDGVANDPEFSAALCFKAGQRLPTGAVSPTVRIRELHIG